MNDRALWHVTFIFKCLHQIFGKGIPVVNDDTAESERPWLLLASQGLEGGG